MALASRRARHDGARHETPFARVRILVDAVQQLSLARSVEAVQHIVSAAARQLTGADGATVVLREGDYCHYVDEDAIAPLWKGQRFSLNACISGWAMLNCTPAVIEDIYADDRIPHDTYRPTFVRSLAMVPMRSADPVGAIGNYWAEAHRPSEEEVELLQALADSTAVAMENVRVYRELEDRVEQRTRELEERTRELEEANLRLVELDAIRTRFAHATTHELRSPLTAILGYSTMLAKRLPGPEADHAAIIRQSATRLSALVDDLLTVAELEHHELVLDREEVPVGELVSVSLRGFNAAAADAGLTLEFEVTPGLVLDADPLRLAQVVDNLISNAIKYTPAGGRVDVRAFPDGSEVVIQVADTGTGIPADERDDIFRPFFRSSAARSTTSGTGLGLRISRAIAEAHGGTLSLLDAQNGGCVFELRLPAA